MLDILHYVDTILKADLEELFGIKTFQANSFNFNL